MNIHAYVSPTTMSTEGVRVMIVCISGHDSISFMSIKAICAGGRAAVSAIAYTVLSGVLNEGVVHNGAHCVIKLWPAAVPELPRHRPRHQLLPLIECIT